MGLLSKYITAKLTESVIEKVGEVTLETAIGIMNEKAKLDKNKCIEGRLVKAPRCENLIGKHYLKVRAAFVSEGFKDISFIVKKDIIKGWLRQDGEVSEISINGQTEINKRKKYSSSSPVVITYHTFRDKVK